MADIKGKYAPVESSNKNKTDKVKCMIAGNIVSIVLLIAEIWCLVCTVISINNLQNTDRSSAVLPQSSYQRQQLELPEVPCNQSSPCYVVEDDIYTKLVKIFSGVKRQTQIRKTNKGKSWYPTWQNCEQFTISNCTGGGPLKWVGDFYGSHGETNGSVTIRESGTYGLYNIFTFRSPYENTKNIAEITHRVHLEKASNLQNDSKVLFERNVELKPEKQAFRTSTFFEFIYLHTGDRVYPSLSDTSFLHNLKQTSMWGVFQIR